MLYDYRDLNRRQRRMTKAVNIIKNVLAIIGLLAVGYTLIVLTFCM
jgi:hypothetical protein